MAIQVSCSCGKTYRVPESLMGSRLTCVECQQAIVIPRPGGIKPTQFPATQPPVPTKANPPSGGSPIQPVSPPSLPSSPKAIPPGLASRRRRLAYGLGASGLVVVLVVVLVAALSGDKQAPEIIEPENGPGITGPGGAEPQGGDDPATDGYPIESIEEGQHLTRAIGMVVCGWKGIDRHGDAFEQLGLPPILRKKSELDNLSEDEQQRLYRDDDGELVERVIEGEAFYYELFNGSRGSCFIVSHDGLAITNKHVVGDHQRLGRNAQKVAEFKRLGKFKEINAAFWVFIDNRSYECQIEYTSDAFDFAILKLPLDNHNFFRLYNSDSLARGTEVVALGFPGAADAPLTEKEIDARNAQRPEKFFRATDIREFFDQSQHVYSRTEGKVTRVVKKPGIGRVIQHNADINPGNSGGPLAAKGGLVVGVNTWRVKGSGIGSTLMVKQLRAEIDERIPGVVWVEELENRP